MGRFPSFVAEKEDPEPVPPQHRWHMLSSAGRGPSCQELRWQTLHEMLRGGLDDDRWCVFPDSQDQA